WGTMQRECGGVFERNSYCAMILVPRTNNRSVCRRKYEIVRQTKFQPHTNIASPWDACAPATPLLQTLRPYGTRPPPLHRFYKHGVPTGRGTPPITRSVNSKILTYNGAGHRITPDVNHQNFRSARNEDPQPTCPSGTKCVAQSSNVGNRPRGTARL